MKVVSLILLLLTVAVIGIGLVSQDGSSRQEPLRSQVAIRSGTWPDFQCPEAGPIFCPPEPPPKGN